MFVCEDCGREFEDWEAERLNFDCRCGGSLIEARECKVCGKARAEEDLINDVCESCIDKCRHNRDLCLQIGEDNRSAVKINSYLLSLFDEKDIEAILIEFMKKNDLDDCDTFIDNDIFWFAGQLVKERYI